MQEARSSSGSNWEVGEEGELVAKKRKDVHLEAQPAQMYASVCFAGLCVVLVLWQGGYFPLATCAVGLASGVLLAVALVLWHRERVVRRFPLSSVLLTGFALVEVMGAMLRGMTLSMAAEVAAWMSIVGMTLWMCTFDRACVARVIRVLCWFGVACAIFGVLVMSGALSVSGAVNAERLQLTFQYANTAGIWLAALALLSAHEHSFWLHVFLPVMVFALLLTQSVGAVALFFAAALVMTAVLAHQGEVCYALELVRGIVLGALSFLATMVCGFSWAPLAACVAVALMYVVGRAETPGYRFAQAHPYALVGVVCVLVLCVAAAAMLVLPDRLFQATQTFVERFIQIRDGLSLLAASPLVGVGPDLWRQVYPFVQTAQYQASSVHCGYLQIALDSGAVGSALFLGCIAVGLRNVVRARRWASLIVAALLLAHVFFDFDLQFSSMVLLLMLLLCEPDEDDAGADAPALRARSAGADVASRRARGVCVALLAVSLACALGGVCMQRTLDYAQAAGRSGDVHAVQAVMSLPFAAFDVEVRTSYLAALCADGRFDELAQQLEACAPQNAQQAIIAATGLFSLGDRAHAEQLLIDELEREPYNLALFDSAADLLEAYGFAGDELEQRYRAAVARANALAQQGNAALLSNQEMMREAQ